VNSCEYNQYQEVITIDTRQVLVLLSKLEMNDGNHLYACLPPDKWKQECIKISKICKERGLDESKVIREWNNCCFEEYEHDDNGKWLTQEENPHIFVRHNEIEPIS
jgi:hypothetical protein